MSSGGALCMIYQCTYYLGNNIYRGIIFFGKDASARWKNKLLTSYPKILKSSKFKLEVSIAQNTNTSLILAMHIAQGKIPSSKVKG
jgi:hypothetical protein